MARKLAVSGSVALAVALVGGTALAVAGPQAAGAGGQRVCGTPSTGPCTGPANPPIPSNLQPPAPAPTPVSVPIPGGLPPTGTQAPPPSTPSTTPPTTGTPAPGAPGRWVPPPSDDDVPGSGVEAIQAQGEIPEARLVDVAVLVLDPGLEETDREKLAEKGLSPELRSSEARYIAFQLKRTLEGTGQWGAVRVVPTAASGLDLVVSGRIRESTGKRLGLEIEAVDATGRRWLKQRYREQADTSAYRPDRVGKHEPFRTLYNQIANDLVAARDKRDDDELVELRRVAQLRFASDLAPEAFAPYLQRRGKERYELGRLPAADDPMLRRVASIRDRDQMLVDTLNDYYLSFYERMSGPYANWRMYSYQEQSAIDAINRSARLKKILGGIAVLAGILVTPDNRGEATARDIAIIGGMAALESGFKEAGEKGVHVAALKELATSFDGEVAPLLVEVEGHQLRLTGSAEQRFVEWRQMLRQVFGVETGAPADPNAAPTPAGSASR